MVADFLKPLGRASRLGLAAGAVLIVLALAGLAAWLLRADDDVLFADLSPQDAAAMTAELERMKVPYRLAADGTTILVARSAVHATRLKLMSRDLPLHGAVGLEVFDDADFGMTEFAQKVNYQRALQGEITRTVLSLAEVRAARVHLALPEDGLFKRERSPGRALVTLAMKRGRALRPEQVAGIQRLVSAAVAGIAVQDVTVVDEHGVALTRLPGGEGGAAASAQLELKKEVEHHLARKVTDVLEAMFGAGRAHASVEVSLDASQVRVTTEDVTAPPSPPGEATFGVIVRERETVRDEPVAGGDAGAAGGGSQRETEYQVGRRVQQVLSPPGAVQRVHVLAVVRAALDASQLGQVQALVGAAVGASRERGDTVLVQAVPPQRAVDAGEPAAVDPWVEAHAASAPRSATEGRLHALDAHVAGSALLGLAAGVAALGWSLGRRARAAVRPAPLTPQQREAALAQLRHWLDDDRAGATGRVIQ